MPVNASGEGTPSFHLLCSIMKDEYDSLLQLPFDYKVSLVLCDSQDQKKHLVQIFKPNPLSNSFHADAKI